MKRLLVLCLAVVMALGMSGIGAAEGGTYRAEETVSLVMERPIWSTIDPSSDEATLRIRNIIKDKLNIDVEVVGQNNPSDQWELPNLMLAAGEQLDIFQVPTDPVKGWRKYKEDGVIVPLNDLLDKYGQDLKASIDPMSWATVTDEEGLIWALPDEQPTVTTTWWMRKDWLDALGMEVPKTFEEFEAVMAAFQENYNDAGYAPLWPDAQETLFAGAYLEHISDFIDENGKLQPVFIQEGYKKMLEKEAEWYAKGFLCKEYATITYAEACEHQWSAGRTGLGMNWSVGTLPSDLQNVRVNAPDAVLVPVAPPSGEYQGRIEAGLTVCGDIMIASTCKNPEAAMAFLNWTMGTKEGYAYCRYGEENVDYKLVDAENGILEVINPNFYNSYCSCRLNKMIFQYFADPLEVEYEKFYHNPETYPFEVPDLLGFVYDLDALQPFKDALEPLEIELKELKSNIVMGNASIDEWDAMVEKYMNNGGAAYYEELTRQLNNR